MGLTVGSWWVNKKTGQKLAVADIGMHTRRRSVYNPKTKRYRYERRSNGRSPDRVPCYLEGEDLFLAWLTEVELRAAWKLLRLTPDEGFIPNWLRKPRHNDVLYMPPNPPYTPFEPFWVSVIRIRSGWLCLTGMAQESIIQESFPTKDVPYNGERCLGPFDWGMQKYNTFFLRASEVVPRLTPKFDRIKKTVYDHINEGGALGTD